MGLLIAYYVKEPTVNLDNALAMINMDKIYRMEDDKLIIFGSNVLADWEEILLVANTDSLDIQLEDGTRASDHTSYYKNIPVLHYFTDFIQIIIALQMM